MSVFCNNCGSENRDSSKFCSNCSGSLQQTFSHTGPLPTKAIDVTGWTLHTAAEEGKVEIVKTLISKGKDVNAKDNGGMTPLHRACHIGHEKVVELLISKGTDVNAKDRYGNTPLHEASYYGHKELAKLLISKGAKKKGDCS